MKLIFDKKESKILSSEVLKEEPNNLSITLNSNENEITIQPILLNPKDYFVIKMLINNYSGDIKIDTRIIGVKKIKPIPEFSYPKSKILLILFYFGFLLALLLA